jgi:hypothetical protein
MPLGYGVGNTSRDLAFARSLDHESVKGLAWPCIGPVHRPMNLASTHPTTPEDGAVVSGSSIADRLDRVASLLEAHHDIVETRATAAETPAWCAARGWDGWLAALSDEPLARCEALGLPASPDLQGAPASLRAVCDEVRACTALPRLLPTATTPEALESVGARKRWQIQALLDAASELCHDASRIVEIGAGRGHLTRVAAHRFAREALGIERDAGRVQRATELAARHRVDTARFVAADALEGELPLTAGDLALGLHACGEIGDRLVAGAARAGCHVALVACCAQKIRGAARMPLSIAAAGRRVPSSRETLGLANLGGGAHGHGIEAPVPASMDAREARWSLRWLLAERGVAALPGEEMRGVNRRRARGGLEVLVRMALDARGMPPASTVELARCQLEGSREFARVRRMALPRNMLGRLLEVFLLLDRAQHLVEHGHEARAGELFSATSSPRNLAVVARAPGR